MEVCNHLFLRGEGVGFLAYLWYNNISVLRKKALLEEPMTHRTQKLLALVLALALCFTGCSGTDYGSATLGTAPTQLPEPPANPYRSGDFFEVDGFILCTTARCYTGVDVSEYQKDIDWPQVAEAGVDFAMIRVGYRGYEQGGIYEDTYARANLQGALDAGLDVGVYFFSQAVTVEEAIEEANVVLDLIKDYEITYPVVFDWEWVTGDARSGDITSRTLTDCTKAFCDTIAAAGYTPMFYFNLSMAQTMFRLRELTDYEFWLAQYSDAMTFAYDVQMWQYTCEGTVPGITTAVDLNLSFLDYASAPPAPQPAATEP